MVGRILPTVHGLDTKLHTSVTTLIPPPHQLQLPYRLQHRAYLTPLQATDPGGTITMVTASGRSFTQQIKTEDTAVQETNPATPGQLVFGTLTTSVKH